MSGHIVYTYTQLERNDRTQRNADRSRPMSVAELPQTADTTITGGFPSSTARDGFLQLYHQRCLSFFLNVPRI